MLATPSDSFKKALAEATEDYALQMSGSPGEEYLIQDRGLTAGIIEKFKIGFVAKPVQGDDMFRGRIAIPFLTKTGPVAIQYRAIDDREPRFLSKGSVKRLYNPSVLLQPHRTVYLCEGPIDTMTVACLNLPVVGLPGVTQWSSVFARAFRNRKVVVLADGDDNGEGRGLAEQILGDVEECDIILFDGEDVNSFWVKHGPDALKEKLGIG